MGGHGGNKGGSKGGGVNSKRWTSGVRKTPPNPTESILSTLVEGKGNDKEEEEAIKFLDMVIAKENAKGKRKT
jgi:hypothetical protein